jgi:hypothetical protein
MTEDCRPALLGYRVLRDGEEAGRDFFLSKPGTAHELVVVDFSAPKGLFQQAASITPLGFSGQ